MVLHLHVVNNSSIYFLITSNEGFDTFNKQNRNSFELQNICDTKIQQKTQH